jgi:hypothetical protein
MSNWIHPSLDHLWFRRLVIVVSIPFLIPYVIYVGIREVLPDAVNSVRDAWRRED